MPICGSETDLCLQLCQRFVEAGKQIGNSGFVFVAHVGETEGFAFDFPIAAVELDLVFFTHDLSKGGNVDAFVVLDAGQAFGTVAFGGEVLKAVGCDPFVDGVIEIGVTGVAVLEAFIEDLVELVAQAVDGRDARGARGHGLFLVLLKLMKVEVVAAVVNGRSAVEGAVGDGENGEAGRKGEGLLATGQEYVDAERVKVDGHNGEAGHGVGHEADVVVFPHYGGNFGERIGHSCGGLVVDEGDGVEFAGGEFGIDVGGIDRGAPVVLQGFGVFAAAAGNVDPLVGESAGAAAEYFFGNEVAEAALHDAPGGRGGEEDGLLRAEHFLETGMDVVVKRDEVLAAVANHRGGHGLVGVGRNFYRSGDVESDVVAHDVAQ